MEKGVIYKKYIDGDTGEELSVPQIFHKKPKNYDFDMIFYGHLLEVLDDLGNKKIQVLRHIIENRNKTNNVFIGTQKDIANSLMINVMTVNRSLQLLEDKGVIKRRTGVVYIDADLVCDGRFKGMIMHVYNSVEEDDEQTKRKRVERDLKRAKEEFERLEKLKESLYSVS